MTPLAARRSAYGSLLPLGILPALKSPINVSSLIASATTELKMVLGSALASPLGKYCSLIAVTTFSFSPFAAA